MLTIENSKKIQMDLTTAYVRLSEFGGLSYGRLNAVGRKSLVTFYNLVFTGSTETYETSHPNNVFALISEAFDQFYGGIAHPLGSFGFRLSGRISTISKFYISSASL